ncbi:hypothetical protein [Mesorhizobium sp. B1-1-2]|uniref:hypothetical protein n=1 Tax=Mesorhizobium sp. B1-1-2 TaxID=2589982 RepID=UPI001AEE27F1|nr:hypothetical protein [Mesorhizobium sp. B1-1-2]
MNAANHLKRYPNARTTTVAYLIERDRITQQLRSEVAAEARRKLVKRLTTWPKWVWRW